jgi:hypothetical protein
VSALATVVAASRGSFPWVQKPTLPANNAVGVATKTAFSQELHMRQSGAPPPMKMGFVVPPSGGAG